MCRVEITSLRIERGTLELVAVCTQPEYVLASLLDPVKAEDAFLPVPLEMPELQNWRQPVIAIKSGGGFRGIYLELVQQCIWHAEHTVGNATR